MLRMPAMQDPWLGRQRDWRVEGKVGREQAQGRWR